MIHLIQRGVYVVKRFIPRLKRQRSAVQRAFSEELDNLLSIPKHARIIPLLGAFTESSAENACAAWNLVLPYAEGGDLHTFLREALLPLWLFKAAEYSGESAIQFICRETLGLAAALAFIHNKGNFVFVIHRDIKPSNILIQGEKFKLADFGLSRIKQSEETSKTEWMSDTPLYRAPERDIQEYSGRPRDIWALGCVFMELTVMIIYGWEGPSSQAIEKFEEARRDASGVKRTTAYWRTMPVVREWYINMVNSGNKIRIFDRPGVISLLHTIPAMLTLDPGTRATAEQVCALFQEGGEGYYQIDQHQLSANLKLIGCESVKQTLNLVNDFSSRPLLPFGYPILNLNSFQTSVFLHPLDLQRYSGIDADLLADTEDSGFVLVSDSEAQPMEYNYPSSAFSSIT